MREDKSITNDIISSDTKVFQRDFTMPLVKLLFRSADVQAVVKINAMVAALESHTTFSGFAHAGDKCYTALSSLENSAIHAVLRKNNHHL